MWASGPGYKTKVCPLNPFILQRGKSNLTRWWLSHICCISQRTQESCISMAFTRMPSAHNLLSSLSLPFFWFLFYWNRVLHRNNQLLITWNCSPFCTFSLPQQVILPQGEWVGRLIIAVTDTFYCTLSAGEGKSCSSGSHHFFTSP